MKPDPHSLRTFVSRWLQKADDAGHDDYSEFDRFIFTYIAFNALYNAAVYVVEGHGPIIMQHAWSRGGMQKPKFPKYRVEAFRASDLVVRVCGSALKKSLTEARHQIAELCECFGPGQIYLHELPNGEPDIEADEKMVAEIRAGSNSQLLWLIYMVRCNLFHGSKALSTVQNQLLSNSSSIVRRVVEVLLLRIEVAARQPNHSFN
jgi:hypothetical protein